MLFKKRNATHCLVKCPVCSIILGDKTPNSRKSFYCSECHTTHWFSTQEQPYKSLPDSLKPKKCSCAQCRDLEDRKTK